MTIAAVPTLTMDGGLVGDLTGDRAWRVHSLFDRVVNLESSGRLLAIAARGVRNAPRTMVVDTTGFAGFGIRVDEPVRQHAGRIRLADLTVSTVGARVWEPRLPGQAGIGDPRAVVRAALSRHGTPGGALPGGTGECAAMSAAVHEAVVRLVRAAATPAPEPAQQIRAALTRLIGLGIGLTPSGDDVLIGAFVTGRWLGGRAGLLADVARGLDFAALTTALSASALAAAREGRGPEPLHDLLRAIADRDDADIARTTSVLTTVGHTSGTDMATGVVAALDLHFDQGGYR